MTIIDLAKSSTWKEVKRALKFHYPKNKCNYESIFDRIRAFKKRKMKNPGEVLQIKMAYDWDVNEKKEIVEKVLDEQYYSCSTNQYSLSFRPWNSLLVLPIEEATLKTYKKEEILAHFFWEITWHGPEKRMKKVYKTINKRMRDIKKANPTP